MIINKEKSLQEIIEILEHGFEILSRNNLKCFPSTLYLGEQLGCNTYNVMEYEIPYIEIPWDKWKLIWNNKEYYSKFKSFNEWRDFYKKDTK
jgi:hypothetical protein